ncbi:Shiga toxin A subunit [Leclercia adecarboxylata]|uniref:Shiga toxin A subunit n=1 Tax=Leclercia adecarboxylata TaxID=83655 RepID=UPI00111B17C6|nr:Shiga toxin A subunit [Leclercia adecarboxylata]QCZ29407.1 Shiga toxin A subunit [Leclercia adecarboxylata]
MFKYLCFSFVMLPVLAQAKIGSEQCADVGRAIELATLSSFTDDLKIDRSTILEHKTEVKLLGVFPVSDILAKQLAEDAYKKAMAQKNSIVLSREQYYSIYHDDNVKSISAKYTFTNHDGKKNVFIALGYINDNECSVDYGGYLTLAREF